MIQALGYSQTPFNPHKPGRLCRGRERWIEPWEVLDDEPVPEMYRLVISGAAFSDDSAGDARRGIPHSGIDLGTMIHTLFHRKTLLAWSEDGHPADIPEEAEGIEAYEAYRAGGKSELGVVRWHARITGVGRVRELLGDELLDPKVRGFAVIDPETSDDNALADDLFALSGMSTLDSPPAQYQPMAFDAVLNKVSALMLLHRDKHGPALGVYLRAPMPGIDAKLHKLCDKNGTLLVPFAIPPMLARWDRALAELRQTWMAERDDEFPVPACAEPPQWNRHRRRDRRGRGTQEGDEGSNADTQKDEAAEE